MTLKLKLTDPVNKVRGVGPRYLECLHKMGIETVEDLLWHFPFRYEDFSKIKKINELQPNETCTIVATITKIYLRRSLRKRMFIIEAKAQDDTGEINILWFNQTFIIKNIPPGTTISLSGKTKAKGKKIILVSPSYEIISREKLEKDFLKNLKHTARLVPIYSETEGISSRVFRYLIKPLLNQVDLKEYLPNFLLNKYNLLTLKNALNQIHFPDSLEKANQAKHRFVFESLLFSKIYLLKIKQQTNILPFPKIKVDLPLIQSFVNSLPFELTLAQKRSIWEIVQNMETNLMNRLLEGDVGSGKTIVAILSSLVVYNSNYQIALLAPTEILATQHYEKFKTFLKNYKVRIALLTSKKTKIYDDGLEGKISKRNLNKIIGSYLPIIVIGTHALIQKNIQFNKLGLVIVDEQHRFGVEQRKKLIANPNNNQEIPHLLSLTATPIPRTLALVFYGDMDISILDTLPQGRKQIITKIILPSQKKKVYEFIRSEVQKGHQAFVICPRIEEEEINSLDIKINNLLSLAEKLNYEVKAVKKEYKKLSEEIFPDLKVAMLHGKMKTEEKENIMKQFQENKINILVSTSVVEVGIDIPNATVMLIEGAEHFGLAQLHQFRGRVGRSNFQSYCFLFTESNNPAVYNRLKALVEYNDGFKLAEIDLSLRGPGELLGTRQSGIPDLLMRSLLNKEMLSSAQEAANLILK
ncbi:MAG: ATP-dependent DNA helicase RecG, partial [Minisyncoccia bacterium]